MQQPIQIGFSSKRSQEIFGESGSLEKLNWNWNRIVGGNATIMMTPDNKMITTCEAVPVGQICADVRPDLNSMKIVGSAADQSGVSHKLISDH